MSHTHGNVLWIDPYPTRLINIHDVKHLNRDLFFVGGVSAKNIKVISARALPIEPLPGLGKLNCLFWKDVFKEVKRFSSRAPTILGIGKPSELATQLLGYGFYEYTFYDAMDDFPAFYRGLSRKAMLKRECSIVKRVDKLIVSSIRLLKRWQHKPNISLTRNACDVDMLPSVTESFRPKPNIVLGYMGTIGDWFDWDLVYSIALQVKPEVKIRLVGPLYCKPPRDLPNNIELLPACSHEEAIAKMKSFSVGLIPFKRNQLTDSVDPIKYYEYRALGLPVLTSSFGEMQYHRDDLGVFTISHTANPCALRSTIELALAYHPTEIEIKTFRIGNSWKARFSQNSLVT